MNTEKKSVLCIDDDSSTIDILEVLLSREGFDVTTTLTASEGLRLVRDKDFDAIVLDNWITDMSGVDVCKKIKSFLPSTPVIFYSAAVYQEDREEGMEAGADSYLIKPDDLLSVARLLKQLIHTV